MVGGLGAGQIIICVSWNRCILCPVRGPVSVRDAQFGYGTTKWTTDSGK